MKINEITKEQFEKWVELQHELWPNSPIEEIKEESNRLLAESKYKNFGAFDENDDLVGFVNVSLRTDYVAGATKYPVGYIEGLFVAPEARDQGLAKALIKAAEEWALSQSCTEMASDVELDNAESQKFHEALGFKEDNRIVCYIKTIESKI